MRAGAATFQRCAPASGSAHPQRRQSPPARRRTASPHRPPWRAPTSVDERRRAQTSAGTARQAQPRSAAARHSCCHRSCGAVRCSAARARVCVGSLVGKSNARRKRACVPHLTRNSVLVQLVSCQGTFRRRLRSPSRRKPASRAQPPPRQSPLEARGRAAAPPSPPRLAPRTGSWPRVPGASRRRTRRATTRAGRCCWHQQRAARARRRTPPATAHPAPPLRHQRQRLRHQLLPNACARNDTSRTCA